MIRKLAAGLGLALGLLLSHGAAFAQSSQFNSTYPRGAIAVTAAFSGANTTSQAITLPAVKGTTTYICGLTVNGLGATAATPVAVTVATLAGGTTLAFQYIFVAGATTGNTVLVNQTFNPCLPASAAETAVTITVPGATGNTATRIGAWGYQQPNP